jgi:hypothetical protein
MRKDIDLNIVRQELLVLNDRVPMYNLLLQAKTGVEVSIRGGGNASLATTFDPMHTSTLSRSIIAAIGSACFESIMHILSQYWSPWDAILCLVLVMSSQRIQKCFLNSPVDAVNIMILSSITCNSPSIRNLLVYFPPRQRASVLI